MRLIPTRRAGVFAAFVACVCAALVGAIAPPAGAGAGAGASAGGSGGNGQRSVIVQARDTAHAAALVEAAGGTVTRRLPIVGGVAADLSAAAADRLSRRPGVAVTPNDTVEPADTTTSLLANDSTLNHVLHREVGADRLWAEGIRGNDITVALVDTGVSAVPDLAGRMVPIADPDHLAGTAATQDGGTPLCVDFSASGTCRDEFGHGTFMGGTIAGNGTASAGRYTGIAPAANLLSVKIAGADGSSDVSKVLAAIQWVVSFRDSYGVEVLNLSLGTNSRRYYRNDPLNHAVERAWLSGITVVVSAGNQGRRTPTTSTISKPADDPLVITVGAVDDRETPAVDDDRSPFFSSTGPASFTGTTETVAKPDVVAPGGRVVSLRAPDSTIDAVPAVWNNVHYRRGSGTSMSAAVVSGVAALMLDANQSWSPNRVKWALATTARKVAERDRNIVGAGLVDAWAAARLALVPPPAIEQVSLLATTPQSLAESRGDVRVARECTLTEALLQQTCPHTIEGEETAQAMAWDATDYYANENWVDGSSWYETQWVDDDVVQTGSSWYETVWAEGSSWYGSSWYGSSWYGSVEAATFYGVAIQGSSWYGAWG